MKTRTVQLGQVCRINPPTPPDKLKDTEFCSFVPMDAVNEVSGQITRTVLKPINTVAKGYTPFTESDVLLAKITPCMENGKCAIARRLHSGIGFGSTEFHVLRASEHVLPEWMYYFWRHPATRLYAARSMTGSAGQRRVPTDFLDTLAIPLPALAEQRQITATMTQADRLCRTRRYALELDDEFLPATFRACFANGHSWPVYPVEELAAAKRNAIRTGPFGSQLLHSEFTNSGVAVLGIDNAVNNRFEWQQRRFISPAKYEELKRYTVHPRDVIITIMGTCGRCAIVPDEIPTAINTKHLCCITLDPQKCLPIYLQMAFLHHPLVQDSLGTAQKGAIMDGLNMEIIKSIGIPLPPLPLQQHFATLVARHECLRGRHREGLRQAEHLFQTLLHGAFANA